MAGAEALLAEGPEVGGRAIGVVFLTIFIDGLAGTMSTPVMPFYAGTLFGASTQEIGYLFAAWAFCSTFFAPIVGRASDTYGRRPVLITALLGAGVANICQGCSYYAIRLVGVHAAFYIFGLFRALSGSWAIIGTVTNIYMADVVPRHLLPEYVTRMKIVGPIAYTFGPSLGGGLATVGGHNLPVIADGLLTLLAAFVVACGLPETPAFLKLKAAQGSGGRQEAKAAGAAAPAPAAGVEPGAPRQVWLLYAAAFFYGISMSAGVSMQSIFLNQVYQLEVLNVTYISTVSAITLIFTGLCVTIPVKNCLGLKGAVVACNVVAGGLYIFMSYCGRQHLRIWFFLVALWLNAGLNAVSGACFGPLLQEFTETSNRGKITSMNQFCTNFGRMVGPLLFGRIAMFDINLVWSIAGMALFVRALLTGLVRVPRESPRDLRAQEQDDEVGDIKGVPRPVPQRHGLEMSMSFASDHSVVS